MRKGYTLIEILIIIAVVGFLFAVIVANMVAYKERKEMGKTHEPVWLSEPVRASDASYIDPRTEERNRKALAEWKREVDSVVDKLKLEPSEVFIFTVDGSHGKYNLSSVLKGIVDRLVALEKK